MNSANKDASYTATEDCYIVLRRLYDSGTMTVKINGQNVYAPYSAANNEASGISWVLAKGDVITVSNPVSCVASVFSLR